MAARPVPEKELKRTQRAYEQTRSIAKAAAALGVSERTVRRRLAALPAERALEDEVALAPAADEDLSIDELVAFRRMVTQRKINAHRVNKLQAVKVKLDGPIAITHIGDPHIDDDGCDIAQLEHDLTTVGRTEGIAHWMFRVSGYKVVDSYAEEHNFHENRLAPSVTTIIDPDARVEAELIKPYWDVEEAADVLTYKRRRAGQK